MIFHKQKHKNGCLQACIASYFEFDNIDDVPNFAEHKNPGDYWDAFNAWIENQIGLSFIKLPFSGSQSDIFNIMKKLNTNKEYFLIGQTDNNTEHIAICQNDLIVWNPSDAKITKPCKDGFYWLCFVTL